MKKLVALSLLLVMTTRIFAQENPIYIPGTSPQDYLKKSKNQKRTAWILLGAGVLALTLSAVEVNPHYGESSNGTLILVGGLVFIGASIPCFTASARNKKKAAAISFRNQLIPRMGSGELSNTSVPFIKLEISL